MLQSVNGNTAAATVRKRVGFELGVLVSLTPIFLYYVPRGAGFYLVAAVAFLCFIALTARHTRTRIWGQPESPDAVRLRRSSLAMLALTVPVATAFFGWCLIMGHPVSYVNLILAFCLYLPWAFLQQTIFQFYLLGRLRALLPLVSPILLAGVNGIAYGLVHWPNHLVMLLTVIGGIFWSYSYLRDRQLWPLAISHAVVGSTFYYFIYARDLYSEILANLSGVFH